MALPAKNLLSNETSPYLLQHKDNPVHWRPWSAEALQEARETDRPILLSVGYAACHWCHVMAHESFENPKVAEAMNRHFVNIKVDREERPEIDQIYMAALSATGEQGGWPLTMFLDSDGNPFWGGTYFPPEQRYGRPGFPQVLEAANAAWKNKRTDLLKSATALKSHVESRLSPASGRSASPSALLDDLAPKILRMIDMELGGVRGAPKFPNVPFMRILWLHALQSGDVSSKEAVLFSLKSMLSGGIYDHVGGGLARYATDDQWIVPHFEKMLYDNAQLLRMLCWAYGETQNELFQYRIEETVGWLLREMRDVNGAFISSLDADTEGVEGQTYLWTEEELSSVLGADANRFLEVFSLAQPEGREGEPILHRRSTPESQGRETETALRSMLDRLLEARNSRAQPGRDDKILVDWNGLTITALAEAGRTLGRRDWIEAAQTAFRFVCESMDHGRLPHSIRAGNRVFPGLTSDHACMISAAAALYQATGDATLLAQADAWRTVLDEWHADADATGYFLTASDAGDVPMRIRGDVDEAIPSATSQCMEALLALSVLHNGALGAHLGHVVEKALGRAASQTYGQAGTVYAAALAEEPIKLVMAEPDAEQVFVPVANRHLDPRRFDIVLSGEKEAMELPGGVTVDPTRKAAYLCVGQTCLPPFDTANALEEALRRRH
ncbi:thioredoxin domain-containing protein [Nitratireductor aquimarinus]|uniref:thioredoxin domain-containing protein n=1 Tax=Nitratireductor aquimarinus TaxID=889300 RepID=UPI001A8ED490|nr:thioredoxin domain-containing protein [Nitratireductor aquimarinus]MBN8244988.1 thioredoxin domain-containing protein [Nitratireductor aquimarinus]MBY6133398.1 thioredoxin domain-containing protein [Nitratireductor aquimarinus]MCA1303703.1 thioredoxin domain-containing protein [Nitratireductor aquimarinus]